MYYIYLYTNIMTGEKYVGQTNNLEKRDKQHRANKGNTYFDRAYSKHPENFILQVLRAWNEISDEQLDEEEIFWIAHLHTKYPEGYNLTEGGSGHRGYSPSEETREKKRKAQKQYYINHPEAIENISKNSKGENNGMFGRHQTEEAKRKVSEANKGRPAVNRKSVRLKEYDLIFDSATAAAEWVRQNTKYKKADQTAINRCCKGVLKTAYGFTWEYYIEEEVA